MVQKLYFWVFSQRKQKHKIKKIYTPPCSLQHLNIVYTHTHTHTHTRVCAKSLSHVQPFVTLWTVAH